ncbi:MAG: hypothetical protein WCF23_22985 [Candidatus Nitrosopolaris sp.]
MTSTNTCPHCNESYNIPYPEHLNNCYESRRASPTVNMFSNHRDYATPKLSGHKELYDLQKTCPRCTLPYNGSWEDHCDKCSVVGMRKAEQISLFAEKKPKTQAEEIAELKAEIENLKKDLENKK